MSIECLKHRVGAVFNRAGVDSKLPIYFFKLHEERNVYSRVYLIERLGMAQELEANYEKEDSI